MEDFYVKKIEEVKKNKQKIEEKLQVGLKIEGNKVLIEGDSINEYEASLVFEAISFGFSPRVALRLKDEENAFKIIKVKDYSRRKIKDVQSRLIGKEGRTKKVISGLSDCNIIIKEGEIGIIGDVKDVENTTTAVINLIRGSKQSNMYRYLERMNRIKKEEGFDYLIKKEK